MDKKVKCSKCKNDFEISKGVKCVKGCSQVLYCNTQCRKNHFKDHSYNCVPEKKKNTNNNNNKLEETIKKLEDISGISEMCSGCSKQKAILDCCKNAHYCSHECSSIDRERHSPECENNFLLGDEDMTRFKMFTSMIMVNWEVILSIYAEHLDIKEYGLIMMCQNHLKNEKNFLEDEYIFNPHELFDHEFKLLKKENLSKVKKKLDKLNIKPDRKPLQIFIISVFSEQVRTFRIEVDKIILSKFIPNQHIQLTGLKKLINSIKVEDIIEDELVLDILSTTQSLIAWDTITNEDLKPKDNKKKKKKN